MVEYIRVSMKEEFLRHIERFINAHPEYGYRSLAQFLEDAARRRAEELNAYDDLRRAEELNAAKDVS